MDNEQLLEMAAKAGAEAAEVYQSQSQSKPVFFEANRLKQLESNQSEGTALRLWRHGRPGLAVAYGEVEPAALVEKAIALSQLNDPETVELTPGGKSSYPDLGTAIPVEDLVAMGKEAIAIIRDKYPEVLCNGEWECEEETTHLVNSLGLDCCYTDITLGCFLGVEWVRGEDFLGVYDGTQVRGRLDTKAVAKQVLQRLQWSKENAPAPTGRVPVLFTAKAASLLWETVQVALSGKQVLEGSSPWSDSQGANVISDALTLLQEPDEGPFSCPFDDEGTPTQRLVFIQDGVLQQFYSDRTTGKLLGIGTTGSGFRPGLGSYPTPGLVNLVVKPGSQNNLVSTASLPELIQQLDRGIVVDQVLGNGAGISGDFSVNVELGYLVENGEIIGRVKDTMVAGNVYTALKQIVLLGGDVEWNGSCYTPSLIVEGLSVTGRS